MAVLLAFEMQIFKRLWASEVVQLVQALVVKPDALSSIPRTYMVKEENQLPQAVLIPTSIPCHTPVQYLATNTS